MLNEKKFDKMPFTHYAWPMAKGKTKPTKDDPKGQARSVFAMMAPSALRKTLELDSYAVLRGHTKDNSRAHKIAAEIAEQFATHYEAILRRNSGLGPDCIIDWHDAEGIASIMQDKHNAMHSIDAGIGSINASVPPKGGSAASRKHTASIGREDVVLVLRSLLRQAASGDLSPADTVRLTEAISRLEGLQSQRDSQIDVHFVLYDSEAYNSLMEKDLAPT